MIIVRSTEIALKLIREMEGESHLVEDAPYLIEEDRAHHGLIIIEGSASRYVIHPVSGEIGIYFGQSSTKAIEKWTEAGGRDWDTICKMTSELSRGASAKQDVIVRLLRLVASTGLEKHDREKLPDKITGGIIPPPPMGGG
jgi:hypothetical protein